MTRFIVIASGKGGVGKTTLAINLGVALNNFGKDVIVLDGNLTTPNIGLYLGVPKVPITLHDVLEGKKSILDAVYRHASGLKVVPGDISVNALNKLDTAKREISKKEISGVDKGKLYQQLKKAFQRLKGASEVVIIDSGAGLNKESLDVMELADEGLIVATPDLVSVTDALKTIKLAEEKNIPVLGVVLNMVRGDDLELSVENIETMLDRPVIAVIHESEVIRKAQAIKHPVVYSYPSSDAAGDFKKLAASLLGERYEDNLNKGQTNWFDYVIRKLGLR